MPELAISPEKVGFLIEKARQFDVKEAASDPDPGSNATDDDMIDVLEDDGRDPVARELAGFIDVLSEDEQIDLVALMRLGRGDGTLGEWEDLRQQAAEGRSDGPTARYLLGEPMLGDLLPKVSASSACPGPRSGPRRSSSSFNYLAQSTITVPSLSPFSTARCACAVSERANCAATL
jgi:hypothetical protein